MSSTMVNTAAMVGVVEAEVAVKKAAIPTPPNHALLLVANPARSILC